MRRASVALAIAVLLVAVAPAVARELVIERFDAAIVVPTDGNLAVTETIRPRFTGTWNGIYRSIPVTYRTPQGLGLSLALDVLSATDGADHPLTHTVTRDRHYKKVQVWVPGASDATRTVELRYRARNALRFFPDHDELYWNVTGDEWEVPIEASSARIVLPAGVSGVRAVAFTGVYGAREQAADVEIDGREVRVRSRRPLGFHEGLTVVVGWNAGIVAPPGLVQRGLLFARANWPLGAPLVAFATMLGLWWTRGRDPRRRPIAVRYEPPDGLGPAEVGTLVDNAADLRDLTATLVDLAVRGWLTIEQRETSALLGLVTQKTYSFTLRKSRTDWTQLKGHEQEFLRGFFKSGDTVALDDLENEFYRHVPEVRDAVFDQLLSQRCWARRPDRVKRFWSVVAVALGVLLAVAGGFLAAHSDAPPMAFVLGGIATGAVVLLFGQLMPARTVEGTRALEASLGFEEFLGRVEGDRLERVVKTPELFERFLPYAMALGVERRWAKAFAGVYTQPPDWYRGSSGGTFEPQGFVGDVGRMAGRTAAALTTAPRSAGGSSGFSSGGGFSGGGMGGGGGGGF